MFCVQTTFNVLRADNLRCFACRRTHIQPFNVLRADGSPMRSESLVVRWEQLDTDTVGNSL
eukprot:25310-Prorocentrum_minimum.AAC.1